MSPGPPLTTANRTPEDASALAASNRQFEPHALAGWTKASAWRRGGDQALFVASGVLLASLLVVEVYDLDVWWQLAIGREILAAGSLPDVDRWTVLGSGRPYHDSHWLFQVALALAHRIGAWVGVQALALALWSVALLALWRLARRRLAIAPSAVLVLLAGVACSERFLPRPELATYAGVAWFLVWFAERRVERPAELAKLGIAQAAWTNAHGLFVLGPLIALVHATAAFSAPGDRRAALRSSAPAVIVTALASLFTPHGVRAWQYAFVLAQEAGQSASELVGSLGEMTSPFAAAARSSPAMWAFYLLLALGAAAAARRILRRQLDAELLLAAGGAALALTGRRNVVLYALTVVPLVAGELRALPRPRLLSHPAASWAAAAAVAGLALWPLTGAHYLWMEIPARTGIGASPSFFPHTLAPRLKSGELGAGLLASNTLGGFVAFHGAPRTLPLTDGRWEVQDPGALRTTLNATRSPGAWRAVVQRHGLTGVLLAHTSPEAAAILPEIAHDPAWRLTYLDAAASLWIPSESASEPATVDLNDPNLLATIQRPEDGILLSVFAARADAAGLEAAVLERTLEFGVRETWILERLGPLEVKLGRFASAERTLERLLELDPESEVALNELAFIVFRRGDLNTAASLLVRLTEVHPDNVDYRENLARVRTAQETRSKDDASP